MGIAVSLLLTAVGLILALAVHPTGTHAVDVNTVGWILFMIGLIGFIVDLLLWSSWGPGYLRRTTVVDDTGGYPVRRRASRTQTVIDDEITPPVRPPAGF